MQPFVRHRIQPGGLFFAKPCPRGAQVSNTPTRIAPGGKGSNTRQSTTVLKVQAQTTAVREQAPVEGLADNVWSQSQRAAGATFSRLTQNTSADVLVVGGGLAGVSVAYHLAKAGKDVILVEANTVGRGQTGRSTAHLMAWVDDTFHAVEQELGPEAASHAAEAQRYAIDTVHQISQDEGIDCGFSYVPGYLFPHDERPQSEQILDQELAAATKAGVQGVKKVDLGGDASVGSIRAALEFPSCANFDPLRYTQGLAKAVTRHGGRIFESTRVSPPDGKTLTAHDGLKITADTIVLATNTPIHRNLAVHSRQVPVRTYVIGLRVPQGSVKDAQFWDTDKNYRYVRLARDTSFGDVLVVGGGADHHAGADPDEIGDPYKSLETWARMRWPQAEELVYSWSGQVYEPVDKLPLYGQDPLNALQTDGEHYVVTGDSGQGTTGGTIAGKLISDQITRKPNAWTEAFAPARAPPASAKTALTEAEYLLSVSVNEARNVIGVGAKGSTIGDVSPGNGAIISNGTKQVAAYVDADGTQHQYTAVCPHLGCVVQWNGADETFNCPCHGAGWTKHGKLMQGPAKSDLAEVN